MGTDHDRSDLIELLGVKLIDDGLEDEFDDISGVNDTLLAGINMQYDGGNSAQYSIDRMIQTDSEELYRSDDGYSRMFLRDPGESWKAIASTLVFGALRDGDSLSTKPYLMAEMVDYFLGINTITDIKDIFSQKVGEQILAYPNPALSSTKFEFNLNQTSNVRFSIFDEMGRLVRDSHLSNFAPGKHSLSWNLTNNAGIPVSEGIYFYHLSTDDKALGSGKVLVRR